MGGVNVDLPEEGDLELMDTPPDAAKRVAESARGMGAYRWGIPPRGSVGGIYTLPHTLSWRTIVLARRGLPHPPEQDAVHLSITPEISWGMQRIYVLINRR